ncbi:unnamed protein product [Thlaspi arvense]|uniref:Uncharacterized protein n=1 Tax=Thlaspi arvense TaxID=13288 RepID=A0AAU9R6M7_THLAR|nr:unnamed protein product [Thlaspi arvense]
MPPPAMIAFDDCFAEKSSDNEWKGFTVFSGESPSPNPNLSSLVKKAVVQSEKSTSPILPRSSVKDDSFRMVLPPAMPPPRDSAVPLPMLPEPMRIRKKLSHQESIIFMRKSRYSEKILYKEEDFKCNAFCLSLPGFGKQKPVTSSSKRQDSMEKKMIRTSSFTNSTVSIRASLEKFECGSWASTTALTQDNSRLFFDFPVEMMKCSSRGGGNGGRDVQEPVTSGFLFDRETETLALRSVLKTRSSRSSGRDHQRSAETSPQRRVRFSTSSSSASVSCPTSPRSCITPRLRKAREDFNTFLSAQNVRVRHLIVKREEEIYPNEISKYNFEKKEVDVMKNDDDNGAETYTHQKKKPSFKAEKTSKATEKDSGNKESPTPNDDQNSVSGLGVRQLQKHLERGATKEDATSNDHVDEDVTSKSLSGDKKQDAKIAVKKKNGVEQPHKKIGDKGVMAQSISTESDTEIQEKKQKLDNLFGALGHGLRRLNATSYDSFAKVEESKVRKLMNFIDLKEKDWPELTYG